jgi:hypothetical protein
MRAERLGGGHSTASISGAKYDMQLSLSIQKGFAEAPPHRPPLGVRPSQSRSVMLELCRKPVLVNGLVQLDDMLDLPTWAIQMYSGNIARTFIPNVAQIATDVEATAMDDMASGPTTLQSKSMRRIRALSAVFESE